ncbi:PilW family protein [Inhella sp.]|uniref:PilW family protein n=1 Tax=Inhella sp. TaxID=1921806 RepID=UPI0035B282AF
MNALGTPTMRQAGFSLIELMIGMLIGLLCTLVIASVLSAAEGNRRGTTSGTDAQIAGNLSLFSVRRYVESSGYGFASESAAVGCNLVATFNGNPVAALPPRLAPVFITEGANGGSDTVRVISSAKGIDPDSGSTDGFTVPVRVQSDTGSAIDPGYEPGDQYYGVANNLTYQQGDLVVAVTPVDAGLPENNCELFEVNAPVNSAANPFRVPRLDEPTRWNAPGRPMVTSVGPGAGRAGTFLVNLGRISDRQYFVDGNQRLMQSVLNTATLTRDVTEVQGQVVLLKAMYGRDTDADGAVDTYDYTTPNSVDGWQNVLAVRMAVVARSGQYEKDKVTSANPLWDVGSAATVAGTTDCGSSKCVELRVDRVSDDWEHYRYRVFDTVVPLRNQRFRSGNLAAAPPPASGP